MGGISNVGRMDGSLTHRSNCSPRAENPPPSVDSQDMRCSTSMRSPQRVCQHVGEFVVNGVLLRFLELQPDQLDTMIVHKALGKHVLVQELAKIVITIDGVHIDAQPPQRFGFWARRRRLHDLDDCGNDIAASSRKRK